VSNRRLKSILEFFKRFLLLRLLPLGLVLLAIYGVVRWSERERPADTPALATYDLDTLISRFASKSGPDIAVISNDYMTVTLNSQNMALSIKNNATGFLWTHEAEYDDMNPIWQRFAASGITIDTHFDSSFNRQFSFEDRGILSYSGNDTIIADVFFEEAGIALQVEYRLSGDTLSVTVLYDSIIEARHAFELQTITLHPFLGASRGINDGFIFVPDGVGAIIDLSYMTRARQPYSAIVFGSDLGFYGNALNTRVSDMRPPHTVRVPVFGIGYNGQGGNALMSVITSGAEHSEMSAHAAGIITPYNWANATFRYRNLHNMALLATGAQMNQAIPNMIDVQLDFVVLSGDDARYDGMARRLQQMYVEQGILEPLGSPHGDMFATFLVADNVPALIGRRTVEMTTPQQIGDIAASLQSLAPYGLRMEVIGYQSGGLTGQSPRLTGMVGRNADWRELINSIGQQDYIFFRRDYTRVYNGASGVRRWNLAQNISEEVMGMHNDQGRALNMGGPNFNDFNYFQFLNPGISRQIFESDLNRFGRLNIEGISFDTMAQMLNSIHGRHRHTRSEMIEFYRDLLMYGASHGMNYAFHNPNLFLWDISPVMTDMPISTSGFTILSYAVPFTPILLSGHAELFAPNANFQTSTHDYFLRLVEFGMRPSYLLTWECPTLLTRADTSWIHSSQWQVWQSQIEEGAAFMAEAIEATRGAVFTGHRRICIGIYESVFSNGVRITVNYTGSPFTTDEGKLVPARQYIVR